VLMLTRFWPIDRNQPWFSPGLVQDAAYFLQTIVVRNIITVVLIFTAADWFQKHASHLAIPLGEGWPVWAKVLLAVLITDFLAWFHHLVRHKVPMFWEFHKIHHSQHHMNPLTDFRVHPVDYLIATMILIVPHLILQVDAPTIVLVGIVIQWHTMLYHSNLRTTYGPLRFILVSPQSHRIHHSHEREHFDSNFGVIFSIWDRLFGTQVWDTKVYPGTGVEESFPRERSMREVLMLKAWWHQMLQPFRQFFRKAS